MFRLAQMNQEIKGIMQQLQGRASILIDAYAIFTWKHCILPYDNSCYVSFIECVIWSPKGSKYAKFSIYNLHKALI